MLKRAYEAPSPQDGTRILVDRLWPRGLRKEDAAIESWAKELAPSTALRRWFRHDPARWDEFQARYREELRSAGAGLAAIEELARAGPVTLLYGARDEEHNQAVILRQVFLERARDGA